MNNDVDVSYPKGDIRRLLKLALALTRIERPTLTTLSSATGHHRQTIQDDILKLREQLGFVIEKEQDDPVYRLRSWGPVIDPNGVSEFLSLDYRKAPAEPGS
jgi:hypothetical protein